MSDTTHSPAPGESSSHTQPKIPAPKDRSCPYCNQAFTSSSLGRHLDLYIKTKNPKPPDGIHNVDEIRRIRGNITRRQARAASVRKSQSVPSQNTTVLNSHERNRSITVDTSTLTHNGLTRSVLGEKPFVRSPSTGDIYPQKAYGVLLNKLNWLATGVINDLPPREDPLQRVQSASQGQSRGSSEDVAPNWRSDLREAEREMQARLIDQLDRGKAADLALREVLNSVAGANSKSLFQTLFDGLNPFELDFPQLVLHILPHPPTLFSQHPFPSPDSWFTEPPDQKHYDTLQRVIHDRISLFLSQQKSSRRQSRNDSATDTSLNSSGSNVDEEQLLNHVFEAWRHWTLLNDQTRQKTWTLAIIRSYTRAEKGRKEAEATMDVLRKQVEHLAAQLAKASNDYSMWRDKGLPPSTILTNMRLSNETLVSIYRQGVDVRNWEYESLLGKWKGIVKEERESMGNRRVMSEAEARREDGGSENEGRVFGASESGSLGSERDDGEEEDVVSVDTGQQRFEGQDWHGRTRENGLEIGVEDHAMEGT